MVPATDQLAATRAGDYGPAVGSLFKVQNEIGPWRALGPSSNPPRTKHSNDDQRPKNHPRSVYCLARRVKLRQCRPGQVRYPPPVDAGRRLEGRWQGLLDCRCGSSRGATREGPGRVRYPGPLGPVSGDRHFDPSPDKFDPTRVLVSVGSIVASAESARALWNPGASIQRGSVSVAEGGNFAVALQRGSREGRCYGLLGDRWGA